MEYLLARLHRVEEEEREARALVTARALVVTRLLAVVIADEQLGTLDLVARHDAAVAAFHSSCLRGVVVASRWLDACMTTPVGIGMHVRPQDARLFLRPVSLVEDGLERMDRHPKV